MKWELIEDGYHRDFRLVNADGLIVGHVRGSAYEVHRGWCAAIDGKDRYQSIGSYVTEDLAKIAVEKALRELLSEGSSK